MRCVADLKTVKPSWVRYKQHLVRQTDTRQTVVQQTDRIGCTYCRLPKQTSASCVKHTHTSDCRVSDRHTSDCRVWGGRIADNLYKPAPHAQSTRIRQTCIRQTHSECHVSDIHLHFVSADQRLMRQTDTRQTLCRALCVIDPCQTTVC